MKYRKKPVVIEAVQFIYTKDGIDALKKFAGAALGKISKDRTPDAKAYAEIGTLEDGEHPEFKVVHIATEGDYIIRGVKGEYYACKPDIFLETYEKFIDMTDIVPQKETTLPWTTTPYQPWVVPNTQWTKNCPKCGINIDGPMGYVCPQPQCPTGLGGSWCHNNE